LEVNKVRSKLKAFAKTKDKSSAALVEIKSLEAAVASAEKASKDASDVLNASKAARLAARNALTDTQKAALAEKLMLAASKNPFEILMQADLAMKARKVAATERDALNDQLSASVSKITLLNEELAQVQKAIARTVEAKAVMSKQSGLLNEKTKIKTALEGLGNSPTTIAQLLAANQAIADITARLSAAKDTVDRGKTAETRIPILKTEIETATAKKIMIQAKLTTAEEEMDRLKAEHGALKAKHMAVLKFKAKMARKAAGDMSGPLSAAKLKELAEAAAVKAKILIAEAAAQKKRAEAQAKKAAAAQALLDAEKAAEEAMLKEAMEMEEARKKNQNLSDPEDMNLIILQEKFKAIVKEYIALSQTYNMNLERDADIVGKASAVVATFKELGDKFWALETVSTRVDIKLQSERRKTAALKPALKNKGFIQTTVHGEEEEEEE